MAARTRSSTVARSTALDEAERLLTELDEFAAWAEGVL
jgi:hypothetical protein